MALFLDIYLLFLFELDLCQDIPEQNGHLL